MGPERSLRNGPDFSLKLPAVVIPVQLAQGCLVELVQDIAELFLIPASGGETGAVDLSQRPHQRVAVLVADFTILIAVPMIKSPAPS